MSTDDATTLPTGKRHISPSELQRWVKCSWAHQLTDIKKIDKSKPSPIPTFGTAVHAAQDQFLRTGNMDASVAHEMIDRLWDRCGFKEHDATRSGREEPSTKDPLHVFLDERGMTLGEACKSFEFNDKSRKIAHRDADAILPDVPRFMDTTFPNWQYLAAEMKLYEPIANTGVFLKGFIDGVIVATGKRDEALIWIIDWKTCAWGWKNEKKQDLNVQSQLVLYKRYWMQTTANPNIRTRDVRCGFVLLKRAAKPNEHCELVTVSVGDTTIERTDRRVLNMISSVRHGVAVKDRNSCMYCDHKATCVGTHVDHKGQIQRVF